MNMSTGLVSSLTSMIIPRRFSLVIVSTLCVPNPKWLWPDQRAEACHGLLSFQLIGVNILASGRSMILMKIGVNLWALVRPGSKPLFMNQVGLTPHLGFIINFAMYG